MELSEGQLKVARQILKVFDAKTLKQADLAKVEKKREEVKGDKWDRIVK